MNLSSWSIPRATYLPTQPMISFLLSDTRYVACALVLSFLILDRAMGWLTKFDSSIPPIGPAGPLSSLPNAWRFFKGGKEIIRAGYASYSTTLCRVSTFQRWEVIVNGADMVEDIKKARDSDISFIPAAMDLNQMEYTTHSNGKDDNIAHIKATVGKLSTNRMDLLCPAFLDEMKLAFLDIVPMQDDQWTAVPAFKSVNYLVSRMTHRILVGAPLCRDPDYIDLTLNFATSTMGAAGVISLFPKLLQPIVARVVSPYSQNIQLARKHLSARVKGRLQSLKIGRKEDDELDDIFAWLINDTGHHGKQATTDELITRILQFNVGAINTTSLILTHAVYDLASRVEFIKALREEVENVVEREGWTSTGLAKMENLNSFICESIRTSSGAVNCLRKVVNPAGFTFSNGITVPYGSTLQIAIDAIQSDEANYPSPATFDAFRFVEKHSATTASNTFLPFGIGRHFCPGRFLAIQEITAVLAHILMEYDLRCEGHTRPPNEWFGYACVPNTKAKLLFRKRRGHA